MPHRLATALALVCAALVGVGGCGDDVEELPRFEPEVELGRDAYVQELNQVVASVQDAIEGVGRAGGVDQLVVLVELARGDLEVAIAELDLAATRLDVIVDRAEGPVAERARVARERVLEAREEAEAARATLEEVKQRLEDGFDPSGDDRLLELVRDALDSIRTAIDARTEAELLTEAIVALLEPGEEAGGSAGLLALARQTLHNLLLAAERLQGAEQRTTELAHALDQLPVARALERLQAAREEGEAASEEIGAAADLLSRAHAAAAGAPGPAIVRPLLARALEHLEAAEDRVDEARGTVAAVDEGRLPPPVQERVAEARDRFESAAGEIDQAIDVTESLRDELEGGFPAGETEDLVELVTEALQHVEGALTDDELATLRLETAIAELDDLRVSLVLAGLAVAADRIHALADRFEEVDAPSAAEDTHPIMLAALRQLPQDLDQLARFLEDARAGEVALENVLEDLTLLGLEGAALMEQARFLFQERGLEIERIEAGLTEEPGPPRQRGEDPELP